MTRLSDDELRRHVGRRANGHPLSTSDRRELLSAISGAARSHRRPIYMFGWPVAPLASAAAAVIVLVATASLLLPRVAPSPGPAGTPPVGSPTPSLARPTSSPDELKLTIYTAAQASELAADPQNEGRVVIVALDPRWPCPGDVACEDEGFIAVRLDRDAAHVGGVTLLEGGMPWTVIDVLGYRGTPALGLIAVDGWLGRTESIRGGEFLSAAPGQLEHLTVQTGAYEAYADTPILTQDGWASRRGIYLLRACTERIRATCDWEVVARILPPLPMPIGPDTSPPGASQDQIFGAVATWVGQSPEVRRGCCDFLHSRTVGDDPYFWPDGQNRELAVAGPPLFSGMLTHSAVEAIRLSLPGAGLEAIHDPRAVVDPDASAILGCRPYIGRKTMLHFGSPHLSRDGESYFVLVDVDHGCEGEHFILEVTLGVNGYEVTRVVVTAHWAV
jgi:hypothetical protein